jgi:hypothetical protein
MWAEFGKSMLLTTIVYASNNLLIYLFTRQKKEQKILCIQMHFNKYHLIEYLNYQTSLDKTNKIT